MSLIAGNLFFVKRLFDNQPVTWAVCAGAAAHLYGNRRPLQDIDILVGPSQLSHVIRLLHQSQKPVQSDGHRLLWRGIKFFDELTIRTSGVTYPFVFDQPMIDRRQQLSLLGSPVPVLAPEDVLLHKVAYGRGAEVGKHDLEDAAGILRRQTLNPEYLSYRAGVMRIDSRVIQSLEKLGVTLPAVETPPAEG